MYYEEDFIIFICHIDIVFMFTKHVNCLWGRGKRAVRKVDILKKCDNQEC